MKPTRNIYLTLLSSAVLLIAAPDPLRITIGTETIATFDPHQALGAGVDGHEAGEVAELLSPAHVTQMRTAGLHPLTYRLRTELAGEAWHWNPQGVWSDPAHSSGYWTSDSRPGDTSIDLSYGYKLPRRGNSIDQANNDGYSRLADGDAATFWKSNPYLHEAAQWVVVDFGRLRAVNAIRIEWGEPRANRYRVQYETRPDPDITLQASWQDFPAPTAPRLSVTPISTRYVRVLLEESSHTPPAAADARDRTGFAIRELHIGTIGASGNFTDFLRHGKTRETQTTIWVSSTDPWHTAADRDKRIEQPGFDRIFHSGLTSGLPMLTPVSVLYDTPENAAAEIAYLLARNYPVREIELGEEPEEQYVTPEDFAALARQTMAAISPLSPDLTFGGPSLVLLAPEAHGEPSWTKRLFAAMPTGLNFFTFEWYPFDEVCARTAPQLAVARELLLASMEKLVADGIPRTVPWYITEYGYSAYGTEAEVTLPGAILNADTVAAFLTWGGSRAYLYGYEPGELLHEKSCTWGNNMLFQGATPLPTYYAAKLLAEEWADPAGGPHLLHRADSGDPLLSAYALTRPNGSQSLLLINKDPMTSKTVELPFAGMLTVTQYSQAEFAWKSAGAAGHPLRSRPPQHRQTAAGPVTLPPYSLTVVSTAKLP